MTRLKYFFFLPLAILMVGCTEVIDFKPDNVEPYTVLVSRPQNDEVVTVQMSRSRFFLDNDNYGTGVSDASLTLTVNGTPYRGVYTPSFNGYASCGYRFAVRPQAGDTLTVSAVVPGAEQPLTAGTRIPLTPNLTITDYVVDTSYYGSYYYGGDFSFRLRFKVRSPDEQCYYSVRIRRAYNGGDGEEPVWDTDYLEEVYFECNDAVVNSLDIASNINLDNEGFWGNEMLFSNELFRNDEHEFTVTFNAWVDQDLRVAEMPLYVEIRALSPELYRYIQTTSQQSDFDELFGEPVQVYCNISGGIGVFGGQNVASFRAPAPRFEKFSNNTNNYFE